MMQTFDPTTFNAFARMMARPDPSDLPRRAHVACCEGDPNRRTTRLPGILMAWLQRRHLETDVETLANPVIGVTVRRSREKSPMQRLVLAAAMA
ncbi:MAG TPA: hypothetical protein VFA59_22035 [Vicinamibacterales bacterium]|nr:hypothetical protein [Vicinamibacterales bacterium]